jgi:penicillin amidase
MKFWKKEIESADYLLKAVKATNLEEFEDAIQLAPMSFNYIVVDQNGNFGYWHGGIFQDRSDGVNPYLPHKGDGTEEWGGFIAFEDLPQGNNSALGYLSNYKNKHAVWCINADIGPCINGIKLSLGNHLITIYFGT